MEAVVARELNALGYQDTVTSDGRVVFTGDERDVARCNVWLRSADRLLIRVGEFPAHDFGQLFDQTIDGVEILSTLRFAERLRTCPTRD